MNSPVVGLYDDGVPMTAVSTSSLRLRIASTPPGKTRLTPWTAMRAAAAAAVERAGACMCECGLYRVRRVAPSVKVRK